jgi:hypothetical protein
MLSDDDIHTVAEELDVNLNRAQINKIRDLAPEYIDWFGAIETAINEVIRNSVKI